jgi:hypothetical protein
LGSIFKVLHVREQADVSPNILSVDGANSRVDAGQQFPVRHLQESTWQVAVCQITKNGQKMAFRRLWGRSEMRYLYNAGPDPFGYSFERNFPVTASIL